MKFPSTIISLSALFLASLAVAMPDDPNRIDTCKTPGTVALTFDDGPGIYNDQLLALLARKNVKATFFVIGENVDKSPAQSASLKKILDAGHMLASHTYTHGNLDSMTVEQMKSEISRTSDTMFKNAGVRPAYMRAPEGACGPTCTQVMTELGLVIAHWNLDTHDWKFVKESPPVATEKSMEEINAVLVASSNPVSDSFVLLEHEIHKFSVDFLAERVIDTVHAKGYKFVLMDECVGAAPYLTGSVVPPPAASGTGSVIAPGPSGTVPSAGAGASGSPSGPAGVVPTVQKKPDSAAGMVKVGAWTAALVAAVGYAML